MRRRGGVQGPPEEQVHQVRQPQLQRIGVLRRLCARDAPVSRHICMLLLPLLLLLLLLLLLTAADITIIYIA